MRLGYGVDPARAVIHTFSLQAHERAYHHVTIEQAAQRLAVNKRTLYREIARGCFPKPIKIRRMARIRAEDLLRYVDSLTSGQPLQGGAA